MVRVVLVRITVLQLWRLLRGRCSLRMQLLNCNGL